MRILSVLTYYRPHTSGLTIYAERLAEAFAQRGHKVTVLTARFDPSTPAAEIRNGVKIVRAPVLLRVSKGVIMPTLGWLAWKHVARTDVVQLHLPQFDAFGFAARARLMGKPVVLTFHCALKLPSGLFNRVANTAVDIQNNLAGVLANGIVTYTRDYADNCAYLSRFKRKLTAILPPVRLPAPDERSREDFAKRHNTEAKRPVIGMATRFSSEKGVEILLDALPAILAKHPAAQVLFAGQHLDVLGEKAYFERLAPRIRSFEAQGRWTFLGNLSPAQMSAFYPNLDLLVVPSLNATEAFGLVQIEAMMNNVPCVASALPGVRCPVQMTGMGQVVPVGDPARLAESILEILARPGNFRGDWAEIRRPYDPDRVAAEYEKLFASIGVRGFRDAEDPVTRSRRRRETL